MSKKFLSIARLFILSVFLFLPTIVHAEIFFQDDFESGNLSIWEIFEQPGDPCDSTGQIIATTEDKFSGIYSAKYTIPVGDMCTFMQYYPWPNPVGQGGEMYWRFRVKFASNYLMGDTNGGNENKVAELRGSRVGARIIFYLSRIQETWSIPIPANPYQMIPFIEVAANDNVYTGVRGDTWFPPNDPHGKWFSQNINTANPVYYTTGQWYTFEVYVKVNTDNNNDGVINTNDVADGAIALWVNGTKVIEFNNLYTTDEMNPAYSYHITQMGGTINQPNYIVYENTAFYFDDVIVSDTCNSCSQSYLQFSSATYDVSEAGTTATVTVTRSGSSAGAVSVGYATSNGTATAGSDYTAASGTLSWADGETASKTFTVSITNDTADENDETVNIALSNPNGAQISGTNPVVLTITDNDSTGGNGGNNSGGGDTSSGGSGCGFVKDDGKGQKAKGEGLSFAMMLIIALVGTILIKKRAKSFFIVFFLLLPINLNAATLEVGADKTYSTIQAATNAANAGDTILVFPGTYNERVTLPLGKTGTAGNKIIFKSQTSRAAFMNGFDTGNANYLRIEGFDITYNVGGWYGGGIWINNSSYVEIVDNYFHDIPGQAINPNWSSGATHNNIYVANNKIYRVNQGIIARGNDWLVENNDIERLVGTFYDADYTRFFGENITFRNNYFHGTTWQEICPAGLTSFDSSLCSHTDGFQTFAVNPGEYFKNVIIEGNIIRGDWYSQGIMLEGKAGTADNLIVRNNIFADAASWGIAAHGIANLQVLNNNFVNMLIHGVGFRAANDGTPTTGVVQNNIFYNGGTNYWKETTCTGCALTGGYNIITIEKHPYYKESTDLIGVDPLFVNIIGYDFHLQSGSQAKDKGIALTGFAADKDGIVRPQGSAWDIGAYEYCASGNCTGGSGNGGDTGDNTGSSGGDSGAGSSGGSGCGFVKDKNSKGQGAKGEGVSMTLFFLLLILLKLKKANQYKWQKKGFAKTMLFFITTAFTLLLITGISHAATYYVSNSGSATWSQCTNINTPCAVQTAFNNAVAGDMVYFRGGTYNVPAKNFGSTYHGYYEPANSGTSGNLITFAAYTGETPIFNGTAGGSGDVADFATIFGTFGRSYIVFDGFTLQADNGVRMARIHVGSDDSSVISTGITIKNCSINGGSTLISTQDNRELIRLDYASNALVQRCRLFNARSTTTYEDINAIKTYHSPYAVIENNEIYNTTAAINLKSDADDAIIRYNYIHDSNIGINGNPSGEIMATDRVRIYHNVIANATYFGILFWHTDSHTDSFQIFNNTIYNTTRGIRIDHGGTGYGHIIHSNIIVNMTVYSLNTGYIPIPTILNEVDYNQWGTGLFSITCRLYGTNTTYTSFSAWQASTEQNGTAPDAHGLASNPLFQNVTGTFSQLNDFRLADNSPSKGTGKGGVDMGADIDNVGTGGSSGDAQAPTVPDGLSAQAISSSQINLSWTASTDNVGVTEYRIYRNNAQIATTTSNTSYSDTGLSSSTTYTYNVSAYDAAGNNSAQSSSASATTQAGGGSGGSGDSGAGSSGGSGCGFVKDNGKGQGAKGEGVALIIMLVLGLAGIAVSKRIAKAKRRFQL